MLVGFATVYWKNSLRIKLVVLDEVKKFGLLAISAVREGCNGVIYRVKVIVTQP
jgi:hypothetical protein